MNHFIDDSHDVDQHHPGRYCDPNVQMPSCMLWHALMWMEGIPEYEEECQAIRDELALNAGADRS